MSSAPGPAQDHASMTTSLSTTFAIFYDLCMEERTWNAKLPNTQYKEYKGNVGPTQKPGIQRTKGAVPGSCLLPAVRARNHASRIGAMQETPRCRGGRRIPVGLWQPFRGSQPGARTGCARGRGRAGARAHSSVSVRTAAQAAHESVHVPCTLSNFESYSESHTVNDSVRSCPAR